VAAGIAIYESEQLRLWLDEHRRKIALAFYAMGDGISPSEMEMRTPAQQAEAAYRHRERRLEIVRRNKQELIERAREQGIAVDLDQLVALNIQDADAAEQQPKKSPLSRRNSGSTFDDIIGPDGKLKSDYAAPQMSQVPSASTSSFRPVSDDGLRRRGAAAAAAAGFASGAAFANPFDDDAHVLMDQDMSMANEPVIRSLSPRPIMHILDEPTPRIDIPVTESEPIESTQPQYKTDDELEAEIEEAIRRSLEDATPPINTYSRASTETLQFEPAGVQSPGSMADSLYDPPSPRPPTTNLRNHDLHEAPNYMSNSLVAGWAYHSTILPSFHSSLGEQPAEVEPLEEGEQTPSGTMTPTDDGFSTISSAVGHAAPDIAVLADLEPLAVPVTEHVDARSESGETNDSFSMVGAGARTPLSWTDVDSESETEAENGQRHITPR
jgi:hypothetical protein